MNLFLLLLLSILCFQYTTSQNQISIDEKNSEEPQSNCQVSLISGICILCNLDHFEFHGKCFLNCVIPYYAFQDENGDIYCKIISSKFLTDNNYGISDYNSQKGIFSTYLTGREIAIRKVLISLWLKIEESPTSEIFSPFLFLTNILSPVHDAKSKPAIIKLEINGTHLNGPTQVTEFYFKYRKDNWIHVSAFVSFPNSKNERIVSAGISFIGFESDSIEKRFEIRNYLSNSFCLQNMLLHVGNFFENENFYFEIKNLKLDLNYGDMMLGDVRIFYKIFENSIYFNNRFQNDTIEPNIFQDMILNLDFLENFRVYSIYLKGKIKSLNFPYLILSILDTNHNVLDLSLDIEDEYLYLYMNEKKLKKVLTHIDFTLFLFKINDIAFIIKEKLIITTKNELSIRLYKYFNDSSSLSLEILVVSEDTSLFPLQIPSLSELRNLFECDSIICSPNYYNHNVNGKRCPEKAESYSYSTKECSFKNTDCLSNTTECSYCFNEKYCAVCNEGTFYLNGKCYKSCPDNLNLFRRESNNYCKVFDDIHHRYMSNGEQTLCLLNFNDQLLHGKKCSNALQEFQNKGCVFYEQDVDCLSCPKGCSECGYAKDNYFCTDCKPSFYLFNFSCVEACPSGYYYFMQECKPYYEAEDFKIVERKYTPCQIYDSFEYKKLCPEFCTYGFTLKNDKCIEINDKNCLVEGREYCEYEKSPTKNSFLFAAKSNDLGRKDAEPVGLINDGMNFEHLVYFRNSDNPNLAKILSRPVHYAKKEEITSLEIQPQIFYDDRLSCDRIYESFYKISFNQTCFFLPNVHFYLRTYFDLYNDRSLIKNIEFSSYTIDMNIPNLKLCSELPIKTKNPCIKQCPIGFYESKGSCIKCPEECLECSWRDDILECIAIESLKEFTVRFPPDGYNYIINRTFRYMIRENYWNYGILVLFNENSCPETCSKCYFNGKKIVCTDCVDKMMEIYNHMYTCSCKPGLFFDVKSKTCVKKCPVNSLIRDQACVENCNQLGHKQAKSLLELDYSIISKHCATSCSKTGYITSLNFSFSHEKECKVSKILEKNGCILEKLDFDFNYLFQILYGRIPLIYLILEHCSQEEILPKILRLDFSNAEEEKFILSAMNFYFKKSARNHNIHVKRSEIFQNIHDTTKHISTKLSILYILLLNHLSLKSSYYQLHESKFMSYNVSGSQNLDIDSITLHITTKAENNEIFMTSFLSNNISFIGLHLQSHNNSVVSSYISKGNRTDPEENIYIANLTLNKFRRLLYNETYAISPNFCYFIVISPDIIDEIPNILPTDESFFQQEIQTEKINDFDTEMDYNDDINRFLKSVYGLCGLFISIMIVCMFIKFIKRNIFEESKKVKFVQLAEIEDEAEFDDVDELEENKQKL